MGAVSGVLTSDFIGDVMRVCSVGVSGSTEKAFTFCISFRVEVGSEAPPLSPPGVACSLLLVGRFETLLVVSLSYLSCVIYLYF